MATAAAAVDGFIATASPTWRIAALRLPGDLPIRKRNDSMTNYQLRRRISKLDSSESLLDFDELAV